MTRRDPAELERMLDRALDDAVRSLRDAHGSEAQARALEQRLLAQLGPTAFATTGVVKVGPAGWLQVLLALSSVTVLLQPDLRHTPQVEPPRFERVVEVVTRVVPEPAPEHELLPAVLAPAPVAPLLPRKRIARAKPPAEAMPIVEAPRPQPEAELALLLRAREALRGDARTALAIAEQHAASYPNGVFAQEREVIAVEALLRTRARRQAFERAEHFLVAHQGSPYGVRLRAMLEQLPRGADDAFATEDSAVRMLEPQ